jgi:hypothetical protein
VGDHENFVKGGPQRSLGIEPVQSPYIVGPRVLQPKGICKGSGDAITLGIKATAQELQTSF